MLQEHTWHETWHKVGKQDVLSAENKDFKEIRKNPIALDDRQDN